MEVGTPQNPGLFQDKHTPHPPLHAPSCTMSFDLKHIVSVGLITLAMVHISPNQKGLIWEHFHLQTRCMVPGVPAVSAVSLAHYRKARWGSSSLHSVGDISSPPRTGSLIAREQTGANCKFGSCQILGK